LMFYILVGVPGRLRVSSGCRRPAASEILLSVAAAEK
jgi:hypothetical protein